MYASVRKQKGKGKKSLPSPKAQAKETSKDTVNAEEPPEVLANEHSQNEEHLVKSTTVDPQPSGMIEKDKDSVALNLADLERMEELGRYLFQNDNIFSKLVTCLP